MKISEDKRKEGLELAAKHGFKELFVNEKGEFFSNKSYASLSVDHDKEKFAEVFGSLKMEDGSQKLEEKTTTDLDKAANVIVHIEAATEVSVVEAILKAETEGKNRATVVKAAIKRIAVLVEGSKVSEDIKVSKDIKDSADDALKLNEILKQVQDDTNAKKAE